MGKISANCLLKWDKRLSLMDMATFYLRITVSSSLIVDRSSHRNVHVENVQEENVGAFDAERAQARRKRLQEANRRM